MLIELHTPDGKPMWWNILTIQKITLDDNGNAVVWGGSGEYLGYSVTESPDTISRMMREAYSTPRV